MGHRFDRARIHGLQLIHQLKYRRDAIGDSPPVLRGDTDAGQFRDRIDVVLLDSHFVVSGVNSGA
jgi:hypothetical protein